MMGNCFLCHRYAPVEYHHVFGGTGRRKKSTKYNAVVPLCHNCHNEPPDGIHHNRMTREFLQEKYQKKLMEEQGWTTADFIREFGRSYV